MLNNASTKVNSASALPQTGDSENAGMAISGLALAVLAGFGLTKFKKKI